MNICPYKGKLKEGQKSCQNGTLIHCLAPNSELIFDLKKLARNLYNDMNVITIETVKHYDFTKFLLSQKNIITTKLCNFTKFLLQL